MRPVTLARCVLFAVALGFAAAFAASAQAGPFEDGLAAYDRDDYATALQLWRPLAERGDAIAQNNLGVEYENGRGVPQDYGEAVRWYRMAAEQGNAAAQHVLSAVYATGRGVPQVFVRAHMWLNLATSRFPPGESRGRAAKLTDQS